MKRIFKRKLYDRLLSWKSRNGQTAVLIEGARRVGKSVLAEDFARREYTSYILIDFSNARPEVRDLFNDISDLDYLFMQLQVLYNVKLVERKSVIVFDEVQFQPLARQAIKHLVADGRYDYIETGSLISIKKNVKDILIPSEEEKLYLYPMDYEEFRWALGDAVTTELLREAFEKRRPLGDAVHRKLMRDFRLYMLVGGMPQVVAQYLETKNLAEVDAVKRQILTLYDDDFRKIDDNGRLSNLFRAIPSQLSHNVTHYQITPVLGRGTGEAKVDSLMAELSATMTINRCFHSNDPASGVAWSYDLDRYKLYIGDTGLFVTLALFDKDFSDNVLYNKLLSDKLEANLGYVYENAVAQMLTAAGKKLFYYTFPTEKGNRHYEIDFLLSDANKVIPLEVKSSGYKRHASIDAFCTKFSSSVRMPYLIYTKDLRQEGTVLYLPVYMVPYL